MSTVLVTGGSGFIGSHAILQLLAAGHAVHTTVRSLKREPDVRAMLKAGGADPDGGASSTTREVMAPRTDSWDPYGSDWTSGSGRAGFSSIFPGREGTPSAAAASSILSCSVSF
jgi:NAD(P)-dependent dehydrogenase (short-subunit alcohol dehydrogenase family)